MIEKLQVPVTQQSREGCGLRSCAKRQHTGNDFTLLGMRWFYNPETRIQYVARKTLVIATARLGPPSSNNIQIISTILSVMAVFKRGFQTSPPPKWYLQPILKVGITTVFVLSLSYFTRDQIQTNHKPSTDTNNGQTRSISLPQTGEKDT
jgi:hypothetical protein